MISKQSKFIRCATVTVSLAWVLAMPTLSFSQGEDASQFDLSTKEGVKAAREAMLGKPLDSRSANCLRRSRTLPIITVGTFAFDRGCRFEGVFVKSHYFKPSQTESWKDALDLLGWQTASASEREKVALAWVEETWLAFTTVLTEAAEDFHGRSFQSPRAVSDDGTGEITVTVWINQPQSRGREKSYQWREYKFSRSGALVTAKTLENFTAVKDG